MVCEPPRFPRENPRERDIRNQPLGIQSYPLGLEGPVVPPEKVCGSLKKSRNPKKTNSLKKESKILQPSSRSSRCTGRRCPSRVCLRPRRYASSQFLNPIRIAVAVAFGAFPETAFRRRLRVRTLASSLFQREGAEQGSTEGLSNKGSLPMQTAWQPQVPFHFKSFEKPDRFGKFHAFAPSWCERYGISLRIHQLVIFILSRRL